MFTFPQISRLLVMAGLLLGMLTAAGCQHMSKVTRDEKAIEDQFSPDFGSPTPELEPVPQMALPPAAPPSDAANLDEAFPEFAAEWDWDPENIDVVGDETETSSTTAPDVSRESLTERAAARAQRWAVEGRLAARRRSEQPPQLPVIVPGHRQLPAVPAESLTLLPVPK